jgi:3-oxoacyl-[acyl-carrier protein] reductase
MSARKTIFITGSSRGIGAAIARLAKKRGLNVILHGRNNSKELERLSKQFKSKYLAFDVVDEVAAISALKGVKIDILVNNAGINPSKTFTELTDQDWKEIFAVNVFGLANVSRAVLPSMIKARGGKIVNIASIKGLSSVSGKPAYAAAKAAVMRMTSSMAEEFAPHNIQVNAVAPGFTDTEMTSATLSPKIKAQIEKIPAKRMAKPEEIAEAVLFLASDRADYVTGQTLVVDGGYNIVG